MVYIGKLASNVVRETRDFGLAYDGAVEMPRTAPVSILDGSSSDIRCGIQKRIPVPWFKLAVLASLAFIPLAGVLPIHADIEYEKMYNYRLEIVDIFPESVEKLVERGYVIEAVGEDLDKDAIITSHCHYFESYPDTCVGGWPDLDCLEIKFRDFVVVQPDPYGFDLDGNGLGCESQYYPDTPRWRELLTDPGSWNG